MRSPSANLNSRLKHADGLRGQADNVHLDAPGLFIVDRLMGEAVEIEIAAKLTIDADEQIEIEFGGNAFGVVIGGDQDRGRLLEIDPDQTTVRPCRAAAKHWQETRPLLDG